MNASAQQAASITDPYTWNVKIQEENSFDEEGLQFLKWSRSVYLVHRAGDRHYVVIKGQFREPVKDLLVNNKPYPVTPEGAFELRIIVTPEKKIRFNVFATALSNNRLHKMQYTLGAVNVKMAAVAGYRWRYSAGTGVTLINFRQKNVPIFHEYAVTVKAAATYRLVPDLWDLGVSMFFNALVLSSDSRAGYKIQYIGFNAKAAYHVIEAPSSWRFTMTGGFYLNSSLSEVGFANMIGPQISPEVMYVFPNGNSLFWYGKFAYSLTGTHTSFFNDNREVAMGLHYSFPVSTTNRVSIGVDVSQLSLAFDGDWASTNTYSLSGGISF